MRVRGVFDLPAAWVREEARGFGPFVTRQVLRTADGRRYVWESRRHRKRPAHPAGSTWWAPTSIGWWIGTLFAIGAACFATGPVPAYARAVGASTDDRTFFIGSIFFTTAAFLQYVQAIRAGRPLRDDGQPQAAGLRAALSTGIRAGLRAVYQPRRIDWWATAVQLVGTVSFNVATYEALAIGSGPPAALDRLVWWPDMVGSACFLFASWFAWAEVCHGSWAWHPGAVGWWIAAVNLAGSVAFGVSAVSSHVQPGGAVLSSALDNLGTFAGALCFLAGAVLLLPERTEGPDMPDVRALTSGSASLAPA